MSSVVAHLEPSESLIKSICYPSLFSATAKATPRGIKYESEAIRAYTDAMKDKHINFKVTRYHF